MRIGDDFKYNRKVVISNRRQLFPHKLCVLCKAAGRMFNSHDLIDCRYLSQSDTKALGSSRLVTNDVCEEDEDDLYDDDTPENVLSDHAIRLVEPDLASRRMISVVQSHVYYTFYRHHPMAISLDIGATTNTIRASTVRVCKLSITSHILWALEPQLDSRKPERTWRPPQEILSVDGALGVANNTDSLCWSPVANTSAMHVR